MTFQKGHPLYSHRTYVRDSEGNEIPPAPFYVTTTDSFLSGWGKAEGKTNKLILPCNTHEEAVIVADNAQNRDDQKYVNITTKVPRYSSERYYVQVKTKKDMPSWYKNNFFRMQKYERKKAKA